MTEETREVEFNNGFVTALCLFYGHLADGSYEKVGVSDLRIYGAADHLYGLTYPANVSVELRRKVEAFVNTVYTVRMNQLSREESNRLFEMCKEMIIAVDEETFGLKVVANYS